MIGEQALKVGEKTIPALYVEFPQETRAVETTRPIILLFHDIYKLLFNISRISPIGRGAWLRTKRFWVRIPGGAPLNIGVLTSLLNLILGEIALSGPQTNPMYMR